MSLKILQEANHEVIFIGVDFPKSEIDFAHRFLNEAACYH
jgi:hypothetical protein